MALRATCSEGGEESKSSWVPHLPSNKGILVLALSGTVELELEYRKPDSKEIRMPHDQEATAQQLRSIPAQAQSGGAFALVVAHHLSSTAVTLVPVVICSTENPKE